jgi:xanthine dehydrogenase YagT iron-sulfur-binding subunit
MALSTPSSAVDGGSVLIRPAVTPFATAFRRLQAALSTVQGTRRARPRRHANQASWRTPFMSDHQTSAKHAGPTTETSAGLRATVAPGPTFGPGLESLSLRVNGHDVTIRADPGTTLAEALRYGLGLTGTKIGCDRGACSACTVWLDDQVAVACMTFAFDARGRDIRTIEGLVTKDSALHPVQEAFVSYDAMQCGFCTPGMVMSCAALIERNAECRLDDIKAAISGHLCRCGAYPNIFKATRAAAAVVRARAAGGE